MSFCGGCCASSEAVTVVVIIYTKCVAFLVVVCRCGRSVLVQSVLFCDGTRGCGVLDPFSSYEK